VRVVAEPAVSGDLEQVRTLSRVGYENTFQKISSMRCYVFGKGERGGHNVLVQEVDVVALGVGWIIVEGQVAGKHGVLFVFSEFLYSACNRNVPESHRNSTRLPSDQYIESR